MNLEASLIRASNLAQLTQIITDQREQKELTTEQREFLKACLWPWWKWMLHTRGRNDPEPRIQNGSRNYVLELVAERDYAQTYQHLLNALCEYVWIETPITTEIRDYLVELTTAIRHRILAQR